MKKLIKFKNLLNKDYYINIDLDTLNSIEDIEYTRKIYNEDEHTRYTKMIINNNTYHIVEDIDTVINRINSAFEKENNNERL